MRQRIDKLGSLGLNTDTNPYLLEPASMSRMFNCVTEAGSLRSITGEIKLFDLALKPIYHTAYITISGEQFLIVSDGVAVYAYQMDGTFEDITPVDETPAVVPFTGGPVNFTNLNGILVVNSVTDGPFYWGGPGTKLIALPGWDSGWRCASMHAFRYYLVALAMTEGANAYPHKLRWSTSAQEGDIPALWVPAADNEAGDDLLGETSGLIVGAEPVRDALFIVKEDAVYEMKWIGGQYVMQVSRLHGSVGTPLVDGFTEMGGGLVLISNSDVKAFDGQSTKSLAANRVRDMLQEAVSEEAWNKSTLFVHEPTSQLLVAGVAAGYPHLSGALVYNWEENTWGHRSLNYCYGFDSAFVRLFTQSLTWDDLGTPTPFNDPNQQWIPGRAWDEQKDGSWNRSIVDPATPQLVLYESNAEDTAWWVSVVALVSTNSDGSYKSCIAERIAIPIEGADGLAMVTEAWLEAEGSAELLVSLGAQDAADGEVRWDGPYSFTPGKSTVITPRITGRYVAIRVQSRANGKWTLGSLTLNWVRAGER